MGASRRSFRHNADKITFIIVENPSAVIIQGNRDFQSGIRIAHPAELLNLRVFKIVVVSREIRSCSFTFV